MEVRPQQKRVTDALLSERIGLVRLLPEDLAGAQWWPAAMANPPVVVIGSAKTVTMAAVDAAALLEIRASGRRC